MLVGVLIVFLMISMVAIAIINRSLQGAVLTADSKKGYATYQNSDSSAESFLNKFKNLDNETSNQIPENTLASSFCGATLCYKKDGITELNSAGSVSDIFNFKASVTVNGVTRTIFAPVPDRIDGRLGMGDLEVKKCDGSYAPCNGSYNKCDIGIKVNASGFDPITMLNYEVRKSINPSLTYGASNGDYYGWQRVPQGNAAQFFAKDGATLLKNGDSSLKDQYGQTYYFSIKARHKNPFSLDSLYLDDGNGNAPSNVKLDSNPSCSGSVSIGGVEYKALNSLGCVTSDKQPAGTETFKSSYNCCNGTECYMPSPHWTNNTDSTCALEKCDNVILDGYTDNVDNYPSGETSGYWNGVSDPGGGYCGSSQKCVPSNDCKYPYRTVGYCTSLPAPSSQNSSFLPDTKWKFNNYVDVDMNANRNANTQPRCTYHTCPSSTLTYKPTPFGGVAPVPVCGIPDGGRGFFSASLICKNTTNCGPYTATVSCNLSCDSGYYPAETKAGSNINQVTVNYSNNCCYESQPGPAPTCASAGYGCGASAIWIPTCGGGHWDYSGCWQPYGCGSDPVCSCGMTGSCTNTCIGANDTRVCNPTKTCTGTREYPCVTGKDKKGNDIMGTCSELYTYACC